MVDEGGSRKGDWKNQAERVVGKTVFITRDQL